MAKEQSEQSSAAENLAPGCLDLWVSQSIYKWVGLNKMHVNIKFSGCNGHKKCEKTVMEHGEKTAKKFLDEYS